MTHRSHSSKCSCIWGYLQYRYYKYSGCDFASLVLFVLTNHRATSSPPSPPPSFAFFSDAYILSELVPCLVVNSSNCKEENCGWTFFILVINQLDAHNLLYNKFISCIYMFRTPCAHREEVKIVLYSLWYHHTCRWPNRAQVERGHSNQSPLNLCTVRPPTGVMIPDAV